MNRAYTAPYRIAAHAARPGTQVALYLGTNEPAELADAERNNPTVVEWVDVAVGFPNNNRYRPGLELVGGRNVPAGVGDAVVIRELM